MASTNNPPFAGPSPTTQPTQNESPPQPPRFSDQQSSSREALDLTSAPKDPFPGTTTSSPVNLAMSPHFNSSVNFASGSGGSSGREARAQRKAERQRSLSPGQSPIPSSVATGRGCGTQSPASFAAGASIASSIRRGRRGGRPAPKPFGGRRTAEEWEAEKAAKRGKYVPRPRTGPKTAKANNPDYVAYSHLQERPLGMAPFEKNKLGQVMIVKGEIFCRVATGDDGQLCKDTARLCNSHALGKHIKSGKHNLPVGPMGYSGNVKKDREESDQFYKDVMIRHRELGGPEPVYSDAEMSRAAVLTARGYDPAAEDYLPDRPGDAQPLPGYFSGTGEREVALAQPLVNHFLAGPGAQMMMSAA